MVIIHLSDIEALHFRGLMQQLADSIEAKAVRAVRPLSSVEELQIDACATVYNESMVQLNDVSEQSIMQQMADYNRQYRFEQEEKSKQN